MRILLLMFALFVIAPLQAQDAAPKPSALQGAEVHVYRADPKLELYVFKPKDWKPTDTRPVLVFFFGGGFVRGNPESAAGWGKWAAKYGMIGVAPDYRVLERFPTAQPAECMADGRRAVRWVQENAKLLGADPKRVVAGGNSAGGGIALWTALSAIPPRSTAEDAPLHQPAALVMMSAPSDASGSIGRRFGADAKGISALQQLDPKMPPVIMFHGTDDKTVPFSQSENLAAQLKATGNECEFVPVPGGSHGFSTAMPEWKDKSRAMILEFLDAKGLVPNPPAKVAAPKTAP